MQVLPLFKSHYSLGKSILTLSKPSGIELDSPVSIFDIALEHQLEEVVVLDNSISGFLEALESSKKSKVKLIYGIIVNVIDNVDAKSEETKKTLSKVCIFIKNSAGYKDLIKISSFAAKEGFYYEPNIDWKNLKRLWTANLKLAIPFYDSFLFKNTLNNCLCVPDFSFTKPIFFIEENGVPFDGVIRKKVQEYCSNNKYEVQPAKSIYYYKNADFKAYLTFRCINNRSLLEKPELEFMCSDKFSFEEWEKQNNGITPSKI
jgi:DNA polymerase III alpha subunit